MPIFQIQIIEGRSEEQIKKLIEEVTDAAVKNLLVNPQQVRVIVTEIPSSHWGVGGITMKEIKEQRT